MSFYVRKIKKSNLNRIQDAGSIADVLADVLNEFRVSGGDLSVWEIPTNESYDIDLVVLALAITNEMLSTMDLLIIDSSIVEQSGFEIKPDGSGYDINPFLDYKHRNIKKLTVGNIEKCVELYEKAIHGKDISKPSKDFWVRYSIGKQKDLILTALKENYLKPEEIQSSCRRYIYDHDPLNDFGFKTEFTDTIKNEIKTAIENGLKNKILTIEEIESFCKIE